MVDDIKQKAGSVFNSAYNKTIYSTAVGAGVDWIFGLLAEFHVEVSVSLQTKSLILAMALVTLLVPNKNSDNGGESNMRNKIISVLPVALILGLMLSGIVGCASQVGQDNVPRIATAINKGLSKVTERGLEFLEQEAPEEVQGVIDDIGLALNTVVLYEDGQASPTDVGQSLINVLEGINRRVGTVEPEGPTAGLIRDGIDTVAILIEIFFEGENLPDEVGVYVKAAAEGLSSGLEKFQEGRSPVAPMVRFERPLIMQGWLAMGGV